MEVNNLVSRNSDISRNVQYRIHPLHCDGLEARRIACHLSHSPFERALRQAQARRGAIRM